MKSPDEQEQNITALIAKTHASREDAIFLLKECDWDLLAALSKWEAEHDSECSSITPSTSGELLLKLDAPGYAFVLPDFERLAPDFRTFLEKDLIEMPSMRRLENSKHLNWWSGVGQKLWPLSTTGDGNCLLHAASLGMWGLHDRQLLLRNAVFEMLRKGSRRSALYRRWKWSEHKAHEAAGLRLSEAEWAAEWRQAVELAAPTPRKSDEGNKDEVYESLESIHVFALAHVLKRPIVVVSDTVLRNAAGEELSPVPFGGVYLPLECPPAQCHRNPLVLCYDSAHFSPLVTMRMDSSLPQVVPVTNNVGKLLPVHFDIDPGPDFTWWRDREDNDLARRISLSDTDKLGLMADYMDLVRLETRRGSLRKATPVRNEFVPDIRGRPNLAGSIAHDRKRILNEITQQVIRALRLSPSRPKCRSIDVRTCLSDSTRRQFVLAAVLNPESHHYMDKMVANYMKSARERFKNLSVSDGRKRISRSLSTSSLSITCIGKSCNQPASQSTNFLCKECFEQQRLMMMSFSVENPHTMRSLRPSTTAKSCTMPMLSSSAFSTGFTPTLIGDGTTTDLTTDFAVPAKRVLEVESATGQLNTTVRAMEEDEDGVTHYIVGSVPTPDSPLGHLLLLNGDANANVPKD